MLICDLEIRDYLFLLTQFVEVNAFREKLGRVSNRMERSLQEKKTQVIPRRRKLFV
jgi:hypothetical protein